MPDRGRDQGKLVVLTDFDECLCQTIEGLLRTSELWFMLPQFSLDVGVIRHYEIYEDLYNALKARGVEADLDNVKRFVRERCWLDPGFYTFLPSYDTHTALMRDILHRGGEVHIATGRPETARGTSEKWLELNGLTGRTSLHMEVSGHRASLAAQIHPDEIYDDMLPGLLDAGAGCTDAQMLLIQRPWNETEPNLARQHVCLIERY